MGTHSVRVLVSLCAILLAVPAAGSEADEATLETLVSALQTNRKAMVAVNLPLEDAEAKAFWPVYDRYDSERGELRGRLIAIIDDYTAAFQHMSDAKAKQLVTDYLEVEQERAALRQRYLEPFSAALPAPKVLRFYQIENKIDAVLRYELARRIPVLEE